MLLLRFKWLVSRVSLVSRQIACLADGTIWYFDWQLRNMNIYRLAGFSSDLPRLKLMVGGLRDANAVRRLNAWIFFFFFASPAGLESAHDVYVF